MLRSIVDHHVLPELTFKDKRPQGMEHVWYWGYDICIQFVNTAFANCQFWTGIKFSVAGHLGSFLSVGCLLDVTGHIVYSIIITGSPCIHKRPTGHLTSLAAVLAARCRPCPPAHSAPPCLLTFWPLLGTLWRTRPVHPALIGVSSGPHWLGEGQKSDPPHYLGS